MKEFNEKYGAGISSRLKKLREEMNELIDAEIEYQFTFSEESEERLKDELSNVIAVSNLDRAIMRLEADQSMSESVNLKRDKLIEAKNIVADILAHSR